MKTFKIIAYSSLFLIPSGFFIYVVLYNDFIFSMIYGLTMFFAFLFHYHFQDENEEEAKDNMNAVQKNIMSMLNEVISFLFGVLVAIFPSYFWITDFVISHRIIFITTVISINIPLLLAYIGKEIYFYHPIIKKKKKPLVLRQIVKDS